MSEKNKLDEAIKKILEEDDSQYFYDTPKTREMCDRIQECLFDASKTPLDKREAIKRGFVDHIGEPNN